MLSVPGAVPGLRYNCPIDVRGGYGYKAWKADQNKIKQAEKEYKRRSREDYLRSEQCETAKKKFIASRKGNNRGL